MFRFLNTYISKAVSFLTEAFRKSEHFRKAVGDAAGGVHRGGRIFVAPPLCRILWLLSWRDKKVTLPYLPVFSFAFFTQKTRRTEVLRAPRFGRNASIYDLHEKAGGLPLQTITAPNIHLMSKHRREVCKQAGKSNIPVIKCGSKWTHYAPSRK